MPALPRLRIEALAELARQLRYQSPESARRQLERAEAVAMELLNEDQSPRVYPLGWVRARITGLTPEPGDDRDGAVVVREALLGDLVALIDRLCVAAGMTLDDLAPARGRGSGVRGWLTVDELRTRWGVSRKSLERMRRRGLLGRRVRTGAGGESRRGAAARERTMFSSRVVELFEHHGLHRSAAARPAKAGSRISEAERERIARQAARYRALGWSMQRSANRIAERSGRSPASVRRAIERIDRELVATGKSAAFPKRAKLTDRQRGAAERGSRAGGTTREAGDRLHRSRATAQRVVIAERLDMLRRCSLDAPTSPLFERADAGEVLLSGVAVGQGLGSSAPATVGDTVVIAEAADAPESGAESARATARLLLLHLVRTSLVGTTPTGVTAAGLHLVETRLLWASRLKAELVRSELGLAVRTIRALIGRDVRELPPRAVSGVASGPSVLRAAIDALIESVDMFDPLRGGRLAAAAGVTVNRAVTAWMRRNGMVSSGRRAGVPARATPRCDSAPMDDWTRRVDPWQAWLEPPVELVRWALDNHDRAAEMSGGSTSATLARRAARSIGQRYGLGRLAATDAG